MPALIVRTGPRAGGRIEIDGEVVVGRGEVDWVIADPELSRRHLAARAGPGGVEVEDLGSLNGTWVDGRRL
ncbi:MAG TPA: FHA domain-containing protein, partial [Solirubrobacteraceae bacterium]|nr:FHA domain-containing protein [Solirubrobacteraceae bacterium]